MENQIEIQSETYDIFRKIVLSEFKYFITDFYNYYSGLGSGYRITSFKIGEALDIILSKLEPFFEYFGIKINRKHSTAGCYESSVELSFNRIKDNQLIKFKHKCILEDVAKHRFVISKEFNYGLIYALGRSRIFSLLKVGEYLNCVVYEDNKDYLEKLMYNPLLNLYTIQEGDKCWFVNNKGIITTGIISRFSYEEDGTKIGAYKFGDPNKYEWVEPFRDEINTKDLMDMISINKIFADNMDDIKNKFNLN